MELGTPRRIGRSESSQLYRNARDHIESAKKRCKTSIPDRYQEDERHRDNLQSEGITKEKVKEWDRVVSGPTREHVPTEAEREHWNSTRYMKQTTAAEAGTVATTKHPDLPKAKEWHRNVQDRQYG